MKSTVANVWSFAPAKLQAKRRSLLAIIALIAIIGFAAISMIGCPIPDEDGKEEITLKSIEITTNPSKIRYIIDEELDTTGMVVTATYSDGSSKPVTGYEVGRFDSSTEGEKTITVSYQGQTATFKVNVYQEDNLPDLESIEITTLPTKLKYKLGEDLVLDGMVVTATYSDGVEEPVDVDDCEVTGYDKTTAGRQTITVTYKEMTAEFSVNVIDPNLPIITITASPVAGTYNEAISVELTTDPTDAVIYYTIDGSEPTEESDVYETAISISETTTIKAFAVKEGNNDSDVLIAEYNLIFIFNSAPELTLEPDDGKIIYEWTASIPEADSYDVYWKEGSDLSAADVKTGTKIANATSGGEITGLTNYKAYSVIVTANKTSYTSIDSGVETVILSPPYTITGSGELFTAKKFGVIIGTADQPIQTVIDAIRGDAQGKACIIHFGNGETALDVGTNSVSFNNAGDSTWGLIELSGKITGNSANTNSDGTNATIAIAGAVSINSTADITNSDTSSWYPITIYHKSTGTLTISGGEIKVVKGSGVLNASTGTVSISGGTLSADSGYAVSNNSTGTVSISGGTFSAASGGRAVYNGNGTVNISGGTLQATTGTAVLNYYNGTVNISGGMVQATTGNAVNNNSNGMVNISGGTVQATTGCAVYNNRDGKITVSGTARITSANTYTNTDYSPGTINLCKPPSYLDSTTDERLIISGGIVENTGANGRVIYNDSIGAVTISGGTVQATGRGTVYSVYSSNTTPGALNMTIPPAVIVGNTYPRFFTAAPALNLVQDSGKITYTWTASTPVADSYDVYWKEGNGLSAAEVKTGTKITGASSGGEITGLTDGTAYSVAVTAYKKDSSNIDSIDSAVLTVKPGVQAYIITGSGTTFTATKGGTTIGTASQPIQTVINNIRTSAGNNKAVFIQFGDGNTPLNIGTASVTFDSTNWGVVELTGKITSAISSRTSGTIVIGNNVSLTSGADIANTADSSDGRALYHSSSSGTVTISGGTITAAGRYASSVYNYAGGRVNITGGTLSTDDGYSVYNYASGTVNISGGIVTAISGNAVWNNDIGTVNISGGTVSKFSSGYAVYNYSGGTVNISGGTVTSEYSTAVYNNSTGRVNITGGTVSTTSGMAVYNYSTGTVNITGGTVENTNVNDNAIRNESTGGIILGGSPTITGRIYTRTGTLSVASGFSPGANVYMLNFISALTEIAVAGGAYYRSNFTLVNVNSVVDGMSVSLVVKGSNLVLETADGYKVAAIGTTYTITKGGGSYPGIQDAIAYIKTQTNNAACTIQFGDGTNVLDIGGGRVTLITLDGWTGLVTLTGKLTSASSSYEGNIRLEGGTSIDNKAELTATNYNCMIYNASTGTVTVSGGTVGNTNDGEAIRNYSTGAVTITGGTVSATTRNAVSNYADGTVNISGGTVSATTGYAVNNWKSGTVNISGGTVQATTGYGVSTDQGGKITVSGNARVTVASTSTSNAAIYMSNMPGTIEISGGTVENTGNGMAVYNHNGTLSISGGTVSANTGVAVQNNGIGKTTVSGTAQITSANTDTARGTIFISSSAQNDVKLEMTGGTVRNTSTTTNGNAILNASIGAVTMSNGTVSTTATSGRAIYNASTGALTISAGTVTAPVNSTAYSIYNNSTGVVTITGGTITGARYP